MGVASEVQANTFWFSPQLLNLNMIQNIHASQMYFNKALKRFSDEASFVLKTFVYMT